MSAPEDNLAFDQKTTPPLVGRPGGMAHIRSFLKRVSNTGFFYLLVSLVFVQGLSYISQFIVAMLLSPDKFGIVRSVEGLLGIAVVFGSLGMPILATKHIAEITDPTVRGRLLGRLVILAAGFSLLTALTTVIVGQRFVVAEARPYLVAIAWSMMLTTSNRTIVNYFQGTKQFKTMSIVNIVFSVLSLCILTACILTEELNGWIIGRYVGEVLFLIASMTMVWSIVRFSGSLPSDYSYGRLTQVGANLAFSLILRLILDNLGLFVLAYWHYSASMVGFYGLSSLIVNGFGLFPGAIVGVVFPTLVERLREKFSYAWDLHKRTQRWMLAVSVLCSVVLFSGSYVLIVFFRPEYDLAIPILAILAVTLPCRAQTSQNGMFLVICNRAEITLWINAVVLLIAIVVQWIAATNFGMTGVAVGTVFIEVVSMALYLLAVRQQKMIHERSVISEGV